MLYNIPNPHGGEVYSKAVEIDFSANINPLGTPEAVKEAVRDSLPLLSQYPDPYCRALVGAIAESEGVPAERVLCGNGAAELIFSLCAALGPKRALLPVPSFSEYRTALEAAGCETEFYFMEQSEDFALTERFLPVLEGFGGDMLLLCNPNNPTGAVYSRETLLAIADIARRNKLITNFGKFADPIADKILTVTMMIFLSSLHMLPVWLPAIVVIRELMVDGLRLIAMEKGRVVAAGWSGKIKTVLQMITILTALLLFNEHYINILSLAVCALTIFSGVQYFWELRDLFREDFGK